MGWTTDEHRSIRRSSSAAEQPTSVPSPTYAAATATNEDVASQAHCEPPTETRDEQQTRVQQQIQQTRVRPKPTEHHCRPARETSKEHDDVQEQQNGHEGKDEHQGKEG